MATNEDIPNRIEVMLMLFAELRKRLLRDNPNSEELEMFKHFDVLLASYSLLREQTPSEAIEETFAPYMPMIEMAISSLKSELNYHDLTDEYRELERIERQLSNSEELTEDQINLLLDRRSQLTRGEF